MLIFHLGLVLFFGLHLYSAFRSRVPGQDIKEQLGEKKYMGLYSVGSALGLGLLIWGYKIAPITEFVVAGIGPSRSLTIVLMLISFILLLASQLPAGYIKQGFKHPMLLAVCLWAITHLIDGANLKQILLFGSFLVYSVIAMIAASRRPATEAARPASIKFDIAALVLGVVVYYVVVSYLHRGLSGYLM